MPDLLLALEAPWQNGALLLGSSADVPWQNGALLLSTGGTYTPGDPPGGGTVVSSGVPAAPYRIRPAARYIDVADFHAWDTRDDEELDLNSVTIGIDADSAFWSIRGAAIGEAVYLKLLDGEQPAQVAFSVGDQTWAFLVDSVQRVRADGGWSSSFAGRSLAAAAAEPYSPSRNWFADDSQAALAAGAILQESGVEIDWQIEPWFIPANTFSATGTALQAVRQLAAAAGAIVTSHPSAPKLLVLPRYPALPNEWRVSQVDVDLAMDAVLSETMERQESPQYDGIYLAGQQNGIVAYIRVEGASGARLYPFLTDPLLTDVPALVQRAQALLGESTGGRSSVQLTIPVLHGAAQPGVLKLNQMVRVQDPAGPWYGLVRAVSATFAPTGTAQQVTLERHFSLWHTDEEPAVQPPTVDEIPDLVQRIDYAMTTNYGSYFHGFLGSPVITVRSGTLPPGMILANNGGSSGNITETGDYPLRLRGYVAETGMMVDSDEFTITAVSGVDVGTIPDALRDLGDAAGLSFASYWTGAIGPLEVTLLSGTLPPGSSLAEDGVLSGTLTTGGDYAIRLRGVDSVGMGQADSNEFTISVAAEVTVGEVSSGTFVSPEQITFSEKSLGTENPVYAYGDYGASASYPTVSFGTKFAGMSLDADTGIVSGSPTYPLTLQTSPGVEIAADTDAFPESSPVLGSKANPGHFAAFEGPIAILFSSDVAGFAFLSGYWSDIYGDGAADLNYIVYARDGSVLYTRNRPPGAVEVISTHVATSPPDNRIAGAILWTENPYPYPDTFAIDTLKIALAGDLA